MTNPAERGRALAEVLWGRVLAIRLVLPVVSALLASSGLASAAPPATPTLSISGATVREGSAGLAVVTLRVTLSRAPTHRVSVRYATSARTAVAGRDFVAAHATLTFKRGQRTASIRVRVIGDALVEPDERFAVKLSRPSGARLKGATAVVTIVNDDVAPPSGPAAPASAPEAPAPSAIPTPTETPTPSPTPTPPTDTPAPAASPSAPSALVTQPAPPSANGTPLVLGTAGSGVTVRLYLTADCSGPVAVEGSAAMFASPGLPLSVAHNATTTFSAAGVDEAGTPSACSAPATYTHDDVAPSAPTGLTAAASGGAAVSINGTAEPGTTVRLYVAAACPGVPTTAAAAAQFASPGVTVASSGARFEIRAQAVDPAGNVSPCSSPLAYVADATVQNESGSVDEADVCSVQSPTSIVGVGGQTGPPVYGQLYENGVTESAGAAAGVFAQVGVGPNNTEPWTSGWTWSAASFNAQSGASDQYAGQFTLPADGSYRYGFRFSLDGAATYTYCDLDGAGSNAGMDFSRTQLGTLTVTP